MLEMKHLCVIWFAILISSSLTFGQNRVDVRFSKSKDQGSVSCFDLEVRSADNADILLAGQNYRIYFNPELLN